MTNEEVENEMRKLLIDVADLIYQSTLRVARAKNNDREGLAFTATAYLSMLASFTYAGVKADTLHIENFITQVNERLRDAATSGLRDRATGVTND